MYIKDVDPNSVNTPLRPLLKQFAGSPFKVAPEKKEELEKIINGLGIRIVLDASTEEFEIWVSSLMRQIHVGLPALERLWAYGYAYTVFVTLFQKHGMGKEVDLRSDPETEKARRLLLWAHTNEVNRKHTPWPDDLPRPDKPDASDPNLTPADEVFLLMTSWILLHETAHLVCKHDFSPNLNSELSIKQELEADQWASRWVLGDWRNYKDDIRVFVKRSMGISFALSMLSGIELYFEKKGQRTHPNTVDRLLHFLDEFVAETSKEKAETREMAWVVGATIIHQHLLNKKLLVEPKKSYATFRDYFLDVRKYFVNEPAITPELVAKHNLTPEEYAHAVEILGRTPSYTELGIFSVMWSEHCSYKNTKPLLKTFPTKSPKILVGAGEENAGIIDIGDGIAIAFKIESHNHPSAVEPFQGATTGVGGIVRDIFTMGARPVCAVNSLRFGPIVEDCPPSPRPSPPGEGEAIGGNGQARTISATASATGLPLPGGEGRGEGEQNISGEAANQKSQIANNKRLFSGVVSGIAHYGNCFGIPTVAGEVYFDKTYQGNPLVNAFCLGVLRHEQITRGAAKGVGNPVFYVGPATGRDGLAGAAFASQDLTEESAEQQRGAVQVGDPFMEKLVCEACLELLATGAVAGMQDMGAAGLTCSTCEMAARAGTGIEIELDKVPQRAPNMSSYEIMLSESQERMLIVVHKGREEEVKRIFDKWDLPWSEIGIITDTGHMKVRHGGKLVVDIPARKIADESPVYQREAVEPAYLKDVRAFRLDGIADIQSPMADLKKLLAWPCIASKNWVYRQYDHQVRAGSVVLPGSDAAVIRIKTDSLPVMSAELAAKVGDPTVSEKLIAMTVDCNGGYVYLDPYEGAKAAVAEACRNLACSGALPLGATDNLNMPSPLKPELFWQIKESVRGLAEGCKAFNAPVTGGNCSLYNQSPAGPIDPTPTISVVGLIEKLEHVTTQWFKEEGDAIILLGEAVDKADPILGLGGSAYLQVVHGKKNGSPPRCDLEVAKTLHTTLIGLIQSGLVKSAHDCSEGGLAVALAESCISQLIARDTPRLIGATIDLSAVAAPRQSAANQTDESAALSRDAATVRLDALLFGETQSRIVISCKALDAVKVVERAKLMGVPAVPIGKVGGDTLTVKTASGEFSAPLTELHDVWWNSIARAMA